MENLTKFYTLVALVLAISGASVQSAAENLRLSEIHTRKGDTGDGLQSMVHLVHADDTQLRLGKSGDDGILALKDSKPCSHGMILRAKPDSPWYSLTKKDVECGGPEIVMLERVNFAASGFELNNLLTNAEYAIAADDPAVLALIYNELAAQVNPFDPELSWDYAERAVLAWARSTSFSGDPVGLAGGNKLTSRFASHVKHIQELSKLEQTGHLDYLTFAETAKRDIYWFRYGVHPEPGAVPTRDVTIQCAPPTLEQFINAKPSSLQSALVNAAIESESGGEYGNAALLFNEAYARVKMDTKMAEFAEYIEPRIYMNAGLALNVAHPVKCDPMQARFVMTPKMLEAVKALQPEQPTGILDFQTIRSFSDMDIGPFLTQFPDSSLQLQ